MYIAQSTCNWAVKLFELSRSRFAGNALRERGLFEREARVPQLQGVEGESGAE